MPRVVLLPIWSLRLGAALGDMLEALVRRPMPLSSRVMKRIGGSACYRADRLRDELGWRPEQDFFDLLPQMLAAERTGPGGRG
jgi:hypothetical protein